MWLVEQFRTFGHLVPGEVVGRYHALRDDLRALQVQGVLPATIGASLDVGSGSFAGSVAMGDVWQTAKITSIDNSQTLQDETLYQVGRPPVRISFYPLSISDFTRENQEQFDIVMGARLALGSLFIKDRVAACRAMAQDLLAMCDCLKPEGHLLISTPRDEVPYTPELKLQNEYRLAEVFERVVNSNGIPRSNGDRWSVYWGLRSDVLQDFMAKPDSFLKPYAFEEPVRFPRDWDS